MALCRINRTVHKRPAQATGSAAAARVQYLLREGPYGPAAARVAHLDTTAGGGRVRDDFIVGGMRNMPLWARTDAAHFFAMAEVHESQHNSVISTEWKITLPRELSREDQLRAAQDFLRSQLGATHPYVWAMHEPLAHDGHPQPHVHCLWSSRTLDGIARDGVQFFQRYNAKDPTRGGAKKDPLLIALGQAKRERVAYTDIMNVYLERAGQWVRLHPDSLRERGFPRAPEPRALPSDSNKAKYHGEVTPGWAAVLAHREDRQQYEPDEQVQARLYWERRKQLLGWDEVHSLDREEIIGRIAAQGRPERTPRPTLEALRAQEGPLALQVQHAEQVARRHQGQILTLEGRLQEARRPVARAEPRHADRTREVLQRLSRDDDDLGGLLAPDSHRTRGRHGYEW